MPSEQIEAAPIDNHGRTANCGFFKSMKKTGVLRRTLVVSDNFRIINFLRDFLRDKGLSEIVDIVCSPKAPENVLGLPGLRPVNVGAEAKEIVEAYRLVISAHCKQIFPEQLYASVECINIHPGFNPETRGWFPQVWAIVFGHKVGVTIHLIDGELDHGEIIDRVLVPTFVWDTSKSLYDRILDAEIEWLQKNLEDLLSSNYSTAKMGSDGNLFLKRDFERLCELSLSEEGTFQEFYNRLRALSFDGYRNAYFVDPETNKKIYVEIKITPDDAG